ncbi:unnamed protein product [Pleuronectes platessa]|uniref:Uncharacterized protein n=1 Tax=Pleuronectes platessa TaxID=8262 RepID=A0A9N7YA86_PLEPL|nr:unnamed protein product [Pleuronectes platessa]
MRSISGDPLGESAEGLRAFTSQAPSLKSAESLKELMCERSRITTVENLRLCQQSSSSSRWVFPYCEIRDFLCGHSEEDLRTAPGVPTCPVNTSRVTAPGGAPCRGLLCSGGWSQEIRLTSEPLTAGGGNRLTSPRCPPRCSAHTGEERPSPPPTRCSTREEQGEALSLPHHSSTPHHDK